MWALPIGEQQRTEDFGNASQSGNADVPETAESWQHEAIDGVLNTLGADGRPADAGPFGPI